MKLVHTRQLADIVALDDLTGVTGGMPSSPPRSTPIDVPGRQQQQYNDRQVAGDNIQIQDRVPGYRTGPNGTPDKYPPFAPPSYNTSQNGYLNSINSNPNVPPGWR
jgi:hypothetical protein